MEYYIKQLEAALNDPSSGGATCINEFANKISEGTMLSLSQANKLQKILEEKKNIAQDLQHKLWKSIVRARESYAASFYSNAGKNTDQLSGIDFKNDLYATELGTGTILFQWCMMVKSDREYTIYDPGTGIVTVGEYFSFNKVPFNSLGLGSWYDLYEAEMLKAANDALALRSESAPTIAEEKAEKALKRGYVSNWERTCYQFVVPFPVKCLISTARRTFDTWSAQRDCLGNKVKGFGVFAKGGEQQVFIPLTPFQRRQFADVGRIA